ncbi:alpha/beta fold hydrolase [Duganella aceris]|uniref:Alpha/beta hydrolase n=1 Tax=Duganella aceris TaxID=2703883 RepID=A0ABX0FPV9_9BURK|nr:alpha/beta hydrolase [Duganella aceris]NGZ86658.1 alpha/beta hydrolase [Duganella aceris]
MTLFTRLAQASLLLAFCLSASAAAPRYTASPCIGDFSGVAQKVECGTLSVDETAGKSNGRRVAMPVAVVRAAHPRAGQPPVIYLHGGPGSSALANLPDMLRGPVGRELVAQDQDWIFFDQRGGHLTAPVLDCGDAALNDLGPLSDVSARQLSACGARHAAAGVDLGSYNSTAVARDVQDLRRALKLERFDLFGVSYGTRVGFAVLSHAPQGVRAAVLDSVWSPDATWTEGSPLVVSRAVALIFRLCGADPACHAAYPDPAALLRQTAQRFLDAPQKSASGQSYSATDLGAFLMDAVYDPDGARSLPRDVAAIAAGDFSAIDAQAFTRGYAKAQHMAFLCKEEIPFERRDHVADGTAGDPVAQLAVASLQRYFDVCPSYPVGAIDPGEAKPLRSAVPTLFIAPEIDPGCPPEMAAATAKLFSHGQLAQIPNVTHGAFRTSACTRSLVRAYLRDPSAAPDLSCLSPEHDKFVFTLK